MFVYLIKRIIIHKKWIFNNLNTQIFYLIVIYWNFFKLETQFERALQALNITDKGGQKILAEKLGQNPQTVSNWKKRDSIPIEFLITIAQIGRVSLDWLITGKEFLDINKNVSFSEQLDEFLAAKYPYQYFEDREIDSIIETHINEHLEALCSNCNLERLKETGHTGSYFVANIFKRLKFIFNKETLLEVSELLNIPMRTFNRWLNAGFVPYSYLVQITEKKKDVSLDWLLFGKKGIELSPTQQMMLICWGNLNELQQEQVFNFMLRTVRGDISEHKSTPTIHISGGNVGQANAGNGNIENLNFSK